MGGGKEKNEVSVGVEEEGGGQEGCVDEMEGQLERAEESAAITVEEEAVPGYRRSRGFCICIVFSSKCRWDESMDSIRKEILNKRNYVKMS